MTAQFYRPQKNDRGRSQLLYATFLIVIVFLLDLVAGGRLRGAVHAGGAYLWSGVSEISTSIGSHEIFASHKALVFENLQLKSELAAYHLKDNVYASMADENKKLRQLTNLAERLPGRATAIISSVHASPYGTFLIAAGSNDGVSAGSVVYAGDGYAIGIVSSVDTHTSLIKELFAPNATIQAVTGTTPLVFQGQGDGNARAQAPRESVIKVGDIVRAPSVNAPIGIVGKVISGPTDSYSAIYIRVPDNLQTLSFVYVARK